MDTRSTNSKRFSFLIAGLLVVVASAVFLMMYPFFQEKAAEHEVDALSSDSFLTELYQGSCVLYKDITETVMGEATDYADLYLTIREEKMEVTDMAVLPVRTLIMQVLRHGSRIQGNGLTISLHHGRVRP